MPRQARYYGLHHLHFITASTYRRARLFDSDRFRRSFIAAKTIDHVVSEALDYIFKKDSQFNEWLAEHPAAAL